MADGCNLYFTEKDLVDVEKSIENQKVIDERKFAGNALACLLKKDPDKFIDVLWNHKDPKHVIVQNLLVKSLSHNQLIEQDEWKLSKALNTVLNIQKDPQGLFVKPPAYRGAGSSSMQHGAELLTTAAIVQQSVYSTSGKKLYIDKITDTIGFGQKLPAKYTLSKRIEADTVIARDTNIFGGYDLIGIDTKYSKSSSTYGIKDREHFDRQMEGVRHNFRDGNLQEFFFVSNVKFSSDFKKGIQDYNIKIFNDMMRNDSSLRKEAGKHLHPQEAKNYIPQEYGKIDFYKDRMAFEHTIKNCPSVPQIELCENVNFKT